MVKGRMLNVIKYLEKHKETGYRQIAEAMDETTRAIRYDIDKINDELSLQKLPLIEKLPNSRAVGCVPLLQMESEYRKI